MPQKLLFDLDRIDPSETEYDIVGIGEYNPQRFEFSQIDAIVRFRPEEELIIARRDIREDEFWVRGHMPGRPIFPGVLLLEGAAQLCSFYVNLALDLDGILGFGGADEVRFRRMVGVGDRVLFLGKPVSVGRRRSVFRTQAVVDGALVFEATILGITLPAAS